MRYYCIRVITLTGHVAELFIDGISCSRPFDFLTGSTDRYSPVDILAGTVNRYCLVDVVTGTTSHYSPFDILSGTVLFHRVVSYTFFCADTDLFQKSKVE